MSVVACLKDIVCLFVQMASRWMVATGRLIGQVVMISKCLVGGGLRDGLLRLNLMAGRPMVNIFALLRGQTSVHAVYVKATQLCCRLESSIWAFSQRV